MNHTEIDDEDETPDLTASSEPQEAEPEESEPEPPKRKWRSRYED